MNKEKYYLVTCKQGHCGAKKYNIISFYIKAMNIFQANFIAKQMPSIKHNSHCILSSKEISLDDYNKGIKTSAYKRNG